MSLCLFTVLFLFAASQPALSQVLVNKVDADQAGTDDTEFVELYDARDVSPDLSGLVLVFFNGGDDTSYAVLDLDGNPTGAGGFFVLCGDTSKVASCDLDTSPNTNLLQNGADAVALFTGDATDFPNGTAVPTTNLLDARFTTQLTQTMRVYWCF